MPCVGQILIQQYVASVGSVGEVIDDEYPRDATAQFALPSRIKRIVIDQQPIALMFGQYIKRLPRVL